MTTTATRWQATMVATLHRRPLTHAVLESHPTTVSSALDLGVRLASDGARPGVGATADLWSALATAASHDLQLARAMEPHLDAMSIMAEAATAEQLTGDAGELGRTWGVYAAEGAGPRLVASSHRDGWELTGVKPWCSLAGTVDAALVTAWVGEARGLFAVDLRQTGVSVDDGHWHARGLVDIPSGPVTFDRVPAIPVGDVGWYFARPGFHWGGIGVAACWYGGAVGVARSVLRVARAEEPGGAMDLHLGAMDELLAASRTALGDAAAAIDRGSVDDPALLAKRVRGLVARTCEEVLWRAGHALGPGPLATDREHTQRVADLQLYIRQHHAERDQASLGRAIRTTTTEPW
jgi:alkylation response protein AidB-like acyl-CoA dehydrogenase